MGGLRMNDDRHRVLIVEDVKFSLDVLREALQEAEPDWVFYVASNLPEAVECVRAQLADRDPVAVVITDLHMDEDEKSGIKLIKAVQAIDPLAMTILYTRHRKMLRDYDTSKLGAFDVVFSPKVGERPLAQQIL